MAQRASTASRRRCTDPVGRCNVSPVDQLIRSGLDFGCRCQLIALESRVLLRLVLRSRSGVSLARSLLNCVLNSVIEDLLALPDEQGDLDNNSSDYCRLPRERRDQRDSRTGRNGTP